MTKEELQSRLEEAKANASSEDLHRIQSIEAIVEIAERVAQLVEDEDWEGVQRLAGAFQLLRRQSAVSELPDGALMIGRAEDVFRAAVEEWDRAVIRRASRDNEL